MDSLQREWFGFATAPGEQHFNSEDQCTAYEDVHGYLRGVT